MGTLNGLMDDLEDAKVRIEKLENYIKWLLPYAEISDEDQAAKLTEIKRMVTPRKIVIDSIQYDDDANDEDISQADIPSHLEMTLPAGVEDEDVESLAGEYISDQTGFCHEGFCWRFVD